MEEDIASPSGIYHPSNRRIASCLILQQLLYYNVFYSLAWALATWIRLSQKYSRGLTFKDPDIVRTIFLGFWMAAEPLRLWASYKGNLKEKVPWMAIAFLLTCFPQIPTCFYLMIAQKANEPFDRALNTMMACFLIPELLLFLYTMRRMLKVHQRQFYLHDYSNIVASPVAAKACAFPEGGDSQRLARQRLLS